MLDSLVYNRPCFVMKMEKAVEQDEFKTKTLRQQQFINVHLYEMSMLMKL